MIDTFITSITDLAVNSGFAQLFTIDGLLNLAMIAIACVLLYLAIAKQYEPLLLLPIAFGMLLVNLPLGAVMDPPTTVIRPLTDEIQESAQYAVIQLQDAAGNVLDGFYQDKNASVSGGLLYYLYQGVKLGI